MFGGSSLPSGPDLLRHCIRTLVGHDRLQEFADLATSSEAFDSLVPELVLQRFSDILDGVLPPEFYTGFKSAVPNSLHCLLARISQTCAVATTNFDDLIELAGSQTGIDNPQILHLHGIVSDHASLVHTIRNVGRGLEPDVERCLSENIRGKKLVLIGYSGNDEDVMGVLRAGGSQGLIWGVRDERDRAIENSASFRNIDVEYVELDLSAIRPSSIVRSGSDHAIQPVESDPLVQAEALAAVFLELEMYPAAAEVCAVGRLQLPGVVYRKVSLASLECYSLLRSGDPDSAVRTGEWALSADDRTRPRLRSRVLTDLGLALMEQTPPDLARVRNLFSEAKSLLQHIRNRSEIEESLLASAVHNLGYVDEIEGDYVRARRRYVEALRMKRKLGDLQYQITTERDLSIVSELLGQSTSAVRHRKKFFQLALKFSRYFDVFDYFMSLSQHYLRRSESAEAVRVLREGVGFFEATGLTGPFVEGLCARLRTELSKGTQQSAEALEPDSAAVADFGQ
jgi:tetratricopeptide (TPR) repeat protein